MKQSSTIKQQDDTLTVAVLLIMTLLPSNNTFFILRLAVVTILFFFKKGEKKIHTVFLIWVLNIFLALVCVMLVEFGAAIGTVAHELSRVAYYTLLVGICFRCRISYQKLSYLCAALLLLHFVIQLTQYFRTGIMDRFIESYYLNGNSENLHYIQAVSDSYSFRSGSIFINPNVYVVYPYLCAGIFLQQYELKKSFLSLVFVAVSFVSVLLTGSRMGILTFGFILLWFLLQKRKFSLRLTKGKFFVLLVILLVLLNWSNISSFFFDSRAFQISEGMDDSFNIKLSGLIGYLKLSNPLYWLFGSLGSMAISIPIDMELGYIFSWFGLLGFYWYFKLLKLVYKNNRENFPILTKISIIAILMTAIGASSILNMNVFPFISVIAFCKLYTPQTKQTTAIGDQDADR